MSPAWDGSWQGGEETKNRHHVRGLCHAEGTRGGPQIHNAPGRIDSVLNKPRGTLNTCQVDCTNTKL